MDEAALSAWAKALAMSRKGQQGGLSVGDICSVKHFDTCENLQGFGLVLDLEGLANQPSRRSVMGESTPKEAMELPELLKLLKEVTEQDGAEQTVPAEIWKAGQVALVGVTATVPPEGACEGDRIDCEIRAIGSGNLDGGLLLTTPLFKSGPKRDTPLALAAGPVVSGTTGRSGPGKVVGGCLFLANVSDEFVKDEKITLVLDEEHADFLVAQDIAEMVNSQFAAAASQPLAKARNRFNVEVAVPEALTSDPVFFVTQILRLNTRISPPTEEER
jgi:flagellar P-ring protein precursor FlgI